MLPYLAGSAAKREMQREFRGLNRRAGAAEAERDAGRCGAVPGGWDGFCL